VWAGLDWQALELTLRLAAVTTAILLVATVPLAGWLVLGRARVRPLVEAAAMLPLALPPTVLGYYLLVLLGPRTAVGQWWMAVAGAPLAFSFGGLVVGSVLYSLPFALQPLVAGFAQVPRALVEAAGLLGAGRVRVLLRVLLPLARPAVVASATLAFAHTVGELGVVLMLGGDIPGRTRTMSIALLDQVQGGDYGGARGTSLVLLGISAGLLGVVYGVRGWRER
jgi:molybdate transport system permease protein